MVQGGLKVKQASLMKYGVVTTATIQQTSPKRDLKPRELTAVIVKLEPVIHGRCSLCHHWVTLPFCLEYFNSEGNMVQWGEICGDCKEQSQGVT